MPQEDSRYLRKRIGVSNVKKIGEVVKRSMVGLGIILIVTISAALGVVLTRQTEHWTAPLGSSQIAKFAPGEAKFVVQRFLLSKTPKLPYWGSCLSLV